MASTRPRDMHFLLTNDDGVDADGLAALRAAVEPIGRATVVAPDAGHSGCGHAVTYRDPITVTHLSYPRLGSAFACGGTPADCVRLALTSMALAPVDLVLAGVNQGANLGVDVYYSGTVAAVREAAILGTPGIAFSQYVLRDVPLEWDNVIRQVRSLLEQLLQAGPPHPLIWNVNMPVGSAPVRAVRTTTLSQDPLPMEYEPSDGEAPGSVHYRYVGHYPDRKAAPGTDVAAVLNGDVSMTPLGLDCVNADALAHAFKPSMA